MNKQFNGRRLKSARIYNGLSVAELAELLGLQRQTVSMYENDKIKQPDFIILGKMKEVLEFPIEFFLQKNVDIINKGSVYFRSLLTTSKKYRNEQNQRITFVAQLFSFISDYVDFPPLQIPIYEGNSPEEAANLLRHHWSLGEKPIENLVYVVEQKGLIVSCFDSKISSIDAFSKFVDINSDDRYLIGYSKNKTTAARVHFDIAHELGHILLHEWSEDVEALSKNDFKDIERQAHAFAGAFLLPKEAFLNDLGGYGNRLDYYIELKKKWKVSMSAMIRRAHDLGVITPFTYQNLMRTMQRKGMRKHEPLDDKLTTASPALLQTAISILLDQKVFTAKDFVETLAHEYSLSLTPNEIEKLLGLKQGTLRYDNNLPKHNLKIVRPN